MSKLYDAKNEALAAYPEDREAGIELFQTIIEMSEEEFLYNEGVGFEQYIYGTEEDEE